MTLNSEGADDDSENSDGSGSKDDEMYVKRSEAENTLRPLVRNWFDLLAAALVC